MDRQANGAYLFRNTPFEAEPWRTSRELLERLQAEYPGMYPAVCYEHANAVSRNGGERLPYSW